MRVSRETSVNAVRSSGSQRFSEQMSGARRSGVVGDVVRAPAIGFVKSGGCLVVDSCGCAKNGTAQIETAFFECLIENRSDSTPAMVRVHRNQMHVGPTGFV